MGKPDNTFWLGQLKELERHCNKKGFKVVYKDVLTDAVYYNKKVFIMSNRLNKEISTYHLLHELGHLKVMGKKKSYKENYDYVFTNFSNASLTHRFAIVQEELDAWREGLILSRQLGIHVNRRKWEIAKTKCISTYLSWAVRNKERKKQRANA